ncbi:MAG: leucine-rich repeat protein [Clostridia bacterium]|nr:leucine-rich repeat protein [Clostridia bacterium]
MSAIWGTLTNADSNGILTNGSGYRGEGMFVGVVDSGVDYRHEAFSVMPEMASVNAEDVAELTSLLYGNNVSDELSFAAESFYFNQKVAFGFDYADLDSDIVPSLTAANSYGMSHGTHVAGIIASDSDVITGVVPNCQLAVFKVFSDENGSCVGTDIIAALSDALILGVDALNMSVGSPCGFSKAYYDFAFNDEIYERVTDCGIDLIVAAGNNFNTAYVSNRKTTYSDTPDNAVIDSPGSFTSTMAVASINTFTQNYILIDEEKVLFLGAYTSEKTERDFLSEILGESGELSAEYVHIADGGCQAAYENVDVSGKVVIVERGGGVSFQDKQSIAAEHGAIACLIYNNIETTIYIQIPVQDIPTAIVSRTVGLAAKEKGSGSFAASTEFCAGPFMSDFSSWGPISDLSLKPDITAPGGMVYSAVCSDGNNAYEVYSGTSMATPNLTGAATAVKQYLKERYPQATYKQISQMTAELLMSTADLVTDINDAPYSPRKQGGGYANLSQAIGANARLSVSGSKYPKLSLGDNKLKTGRYTLNFDLMNMSDEELTYDVNMVVMTCGLGSDNYTITTEDHVFDDYIYTVCADYVPTDGSVTVGANATLTITVILELGETAKAYLDDYFQYGSYVEGYVILDCGDEEQKLNLPYLAFYGDWCKAPIFDYTCFDEEEEYVYPITLSGIYSNSYLLALGNYHYGLPDGEEPIEPNADRAAISAYSLSIANLYGIYYGLLRNIDYYSLTIMDVNTKEEYVWGTIDHVRKANYQLGATLVTIGLSPFTEGLYNNQELLITMEAHMDYYGGESERSKVEMPLYVDFEAPTVVQSEFRTENGRTHIDFEVFDNQYPMSYSVLDYSGDEPVSLTTYAVPFRNAVKNSSNYISADVTDYIDAIKAGTVYFVFEDYAMNSTIFKINGNADSNDLQNETDFANGDVIKSTVSEREYELYLNENLSFDNKIALNTFRECGGLDKITLPQTVTAVERRAFESCYSLVEVVLNRSVESISERAFFGCSSLRYINTEDTALKSIGASAFYNGRKLTVMELPETVENIGDNAFGKGVLRPLTIYATTPPTVGANGFGTEELCIYVKAAVVEEYKLSFGVYADNLSSLDDFILQDGKLIAYKGTGAVSLPKGIRSIGAYAFSQSGVTAVESLCDLTEVCDNAFADCDKLAFVSLPDSVKAIGSRAFASQNSTEVELNSLLPPAIRSDNFDGVPEDFVVKVPIDSAEYYANDADWAKIADSVEIINQFTVVDGVLTAYMGTDEHVIIPDEVVTIAQRVFEDNVFIQSLTLGANVQTIEQYAFADCVNLQSVEFNDGLQSIGYGVFNGCEKLEAIALPDSLTVLGGYCFNGCVSLTTLVMSPNIEIIEYGTFYNCYLLQDFELPDKLTAIDGSAFFNCKSLTEMDLSENVSHIGFLAFLNCESMRKLTVRADLAGTRNAFGGMTALEELNLYGDIGRIGLIEGTGIDFSATKLKELHFYGNVGDIYGSSICCNDYLRKRSRTAYIISIYT